MATSQQIQQYLNQAMGLMQQGEFERALKIFHALENAGMQDFRLFRAIGGAYQRLHQPQRASQYLERSLQLSDGQTDLYLALAKLHTQMDSWAKATDWYDKAVGREKNDEAVISYARFLLMDAVADPSKALSLLASTGNQGADTEEAGLLRAQAYGQLGDKKAQQRELLTLLTSWPESKNVQSSLAWFYKSTQQNELAEKYFVSAAEHPQATDADAENLALFKLATDALDDAYECIETALTRFNYSRKLLKLQASVRYEKGEADYLSGYQTKPVTKLPAQVAFDYLDQCIKSNQLAHAEEVMRALRDTHQSAPYYIQRQALLSYERKEYETTIDILNKIISGDPKNTILLTLMVRAMLANGDYHRSQQYLSTLLNIAPNDQYYWALQATQWRLTNDQRYAWLCDTDTLVKPVTLHCPHGYSSTRQFIDELKGALESLHTMKQQPLEQSLVKGTQTTGHLFERATPVLQSLKSALYETATEALSTLPVDSLHPTLKFAGRDITFATSWSVRLSNQGFHVAHVHPKGWYSSAFYVDVPVSLSDKTKAGWLHLGKPGLVTADQLDAEQWVKPEPGTLALFPSFMWHGTSPFESDDHRLTVAFDLRSKGSGT